MSSSSAMNLSCPIPANESSVILLAHGEGARLSRRLIEEEILSVFDCDPLRSLSDAASLPDLRGPLAMTTDCFVVTPLFFPGGDIGRLAVHGTVNDLAVVGAEPVYLSVGLIIEEGLPIEILRRVLNSIGASARSCDVSIVTGDTKVVPRGAADRLYVTTTGIGRLHTGLNLGAQCVQPGDVVLVSGTLGDHGIAILAARESFAFSTELQSDSASVHGLVAALLDAAIAVRWMRDPTRGGLSAVLHELAEMAGLVIEIDEVRLPVNNAVRGACEVLGLDPIHVANEGKLVAVVAAQDADRALGAMRSHPLGYSAGIVGRIVERSRPQVLVRSAFGGVRVLDEPQGAPLPRIC